MGFLSKIFRAITKLGSSAWGAAKSLGQGAWNAVTSFFTFGSSLSLDGVTSSFSDAIGSVVGALGLGGGTLGNMLSGAIEYAGYGALTGAATAAVTGGDIGKGAAQGALIGGAAGGVVGAGRPTSVLGQVSGGPSPSSGPFGPPQGVDALAARAAGGNTDGGIGRIFAEGGWLERNSDIVGPIIAGLGEGALTAMATNDEIAARERMQRNTQRSPGSTWNPIAGERWRRPREDIPESRTGTLHPSNIY